MRPRIAIGMYESTNSRHGIMERGLLMTDSWNGYFGDLHAVKRTYNFLGRVGENRYYITQLFWNDKIAGKKVLESRMLLFE